MSESQGEGQYWFNVLTHQVEKGPQSNWTQLLGPYDSAAEAETAMEKVRRRNEQFDEEDEAESD